MPVARTPPDNGGKRTHSGDQNMDAKEHELFNLRLTIQKLEEVSFLSLSPTAIAHTLP